MDIPKVYDLCNPTLKALCILGGRGTVKEIGKVLVQQMQLPSEAVQREHWPGALSELDYRLRWALTILHAHGLIIGSDADQWALTEKCTPESSVDAEAIKMFYASEEGNGYGLLPHEVADILEDDLWQRLGYETEWQRDDEAVLKQDET